MRAGPYVWSYHDGPRSGIAEFPGKPDSTTETLRPGRIAFLTASLSFIAAPAFRIELEADALDAGPQL